MIVETKYNADLIESRVVEQSWYGAHEFARQVIALRDQQVREALIALGWTPPEG